MRAVKLANYENVTEFMGSVSATEKGIFFAPNEMLAFPQMFTRKDLVDSAKENPELAQATFANLQEQGVYVYLFEYLE